ncbi:DUF572-domain-containing protein [Schizopora paradoxa]|uniref:DUF572-domain-containing protein n=1 Tax=Schizopora paradoxa TaxID=27342 RepID=A0A0H2REG0_9AGAM|nr:DUF572-domain-containing protein [Schizopora paradoxa]
MQGFNKYYPPDYDPQQHNSLNAYRGKHALGDRARKIDKGILITRFELPFNIWCGGCDAHIGMGVRFNAEKKKIGNYHSTPIYEFRCKCHLCSNWFTIETDPKNTRYVVTSGARQKHEDWDPEENGGHAVHDSEGKAPDDPLAALEKTHTALVHTQQVQAPRLESLQENSEKYNADPYTLSSRVRKHFRVEKRELKRKKDEDDAVKTKYGLPEELVLSANDEVTSKDAKEEFLRARRAVGADQEAKRQKLVAEAGQPRPLASLSRLPSQSKRPPSSLSKTPSSSSSNLKSNAKMTASQTLRLKLLESRGRKADPFLNSSTLSSRLRPPDLGIITKK